MRKINHETVGARDFRRGLTRFLNDAEHRFLPTMVTRNGRPAAVLMSFERLQSIAAQLRYGLSNPADLRLHSPGNAAVIEREIAELERCFNGAEVAP